MSGSSLFASFVLFNNYNSLQASEAEIFVLFVEPLIWIYSLFSTKYNQNLENLFPKLEYFKVCFEVKNCLMSAISYHLS